MTNPTNPPQITIPPAVLQAAKNRNKTRPNLPPALESGSGARGQRPLLVILLALAFAMALLATYTAWKVGDASGRADIFFSWWPIFLLAISLSVSFGVGLAWRSHDIEKYEEFLEFQRALSEPMEDVPVSEEARQRIARMRVLHELTAALAAAVKADHAALALCLYDLETLFAVEAIPALGRASEAIHEIVEGLDPSEDLP